MACLIDLWVGWTVACNRAMVRYGWAGPLPPVHSSRFWCLGFIYQNVLARVRWASWMKKRAGQSWALEDLSGVLFVGANRWEETGSREMYGDHSCSPGERWWAGSRLGVGQGNSGVERWGVESVSGEDWGTSRMVWGSGEKGAGQPRWGCVFWT